ncbi:MAG TPA: indolepyruvate ferredoxin oxidoreductase family protein [Trebonia sp.]
MTEMLTGRRSRASAGPGPGEPAFQVASLDDRYLREDGTIYLNGIHALVRMLLDRVRYDRRQGANIATYISGYEGSPLAGYDLELARHPRLLSESGITHRPGLNEELAATAVSGTQLAGTIGTATHDGVTGVWYGKAPGLDRATDALRHANMIGTSPRGGAVALVGDDPAAKSSSLPSASEMALADLGLPTFFPADPAEVLQHGMHAIELSRASGLWTAIKVVTGVADGSATAALAPGGWQAPDLSELPAGLAPYRHKPRARLLGAELAALERSQLNVRVPTALEYIRRSGLNLVGGPQRARIGIVTAGKTYLDVRQALAALGVDGDIRVLKLGVVYPLEPDVVRELAAGVDEIIVVEDKRAFLEDAVKSALYATPRAPRVSGRHDQQGRALFPATGELDADVIADVLARHLTALGLPVTDRPRLERERIALPLAPRMPYFCSGCPHNSSTKVAPGTLVGAGIGCHAMVSFMPSPQVGEVTGLCQMGGEGAQWIGLAPFISERHLVQNVGDGTFAHSGSLAIRAAVAAGVNITYKLLRNSAVAMTGGQRAVGELPVRQLVDLLIAEGVGKVVVTSDEPARLRRQLGRAIDIRHRDEVLAVQQELAAIEGVTVLIHDQECAAEKRRQRRRGKAAPPARRAFINQRVCEGCGDCGAKSNCLSVQPVTTAFGRKTQIDQSSCNLDFSCLAGDCPSFLTVIPAPRRRRAAPALPAVLAEPARLVTADPFAMRITGVGGTGVVTAAQVLGTAFAAEGRQVRALDQTGLAQKGGAVVSDLIVASGPVGGAHPGGPPAGRSAKVSAGECDLYLGCDSLVATDGTYLRAASRDKTIAVVSTSELPTGHMVVDTTLGFPATGAVMAAIEAKVKSARFLDAAAVARERFGDEQFANMLLVGVAYQAGALPVGAAAIEHAITLNAVAVDANIGAFRYGRGMLPGMTAAAVAGPEQDLAGLLAVRARELAAFQDDACAADYLAFVERVRAREAEITGSAIAGPDEAPGSDELARAVAEGLYKLTAYKDEYEVARLSLDPALDEQLAATFGEGARFSYRLHPPVLRALGMQRKISLGRWARPALRVLAGLRRLRGTGLDPFGRTEVRRLERALVVEYRQVVETLLAGLARDNHSLAAQIAALPDTVRGYEDIKLASVRAYRETLSRLLAEYAQESVT